MKRIDAIFDIEREINGRSIAERLVAWRAQVVPPVMEPETWMPAVQEQIRGRRVYRRGRRSRQALRGVAKTRAMKKLKTQ